MGKQVTRRNPSSLCLDLKVAEALHNGTTVAFFYIYVTCIEFAVCNPEKWCKCIIEMFVAIAFLSLS